VPFVLREHSQPTKPALRFHEFAKGQGALQAAIDALKRINGRYPGKHKSVEQIARILSGKGMCNASYQQKIRSNCPRLLL